NAQALAVSGAVNGGASTVLETTAGNLAINGAVNGTTTTLTSAGAITEGATGVITTGTLTGSSVGSTTLNGANVVGALGAFSTGGNFSFNNTQTLTVNNAPSANGGAGDLALTTTGASSDLILASNLIGNTVTLSAGRNISQTGGAITATTLTGSSVGSTTLTGANLIGALGNFTASSFALTNAQALAVTGAVNGGASTTLTTTTGDLAINGAVNGTTTTLTSAGAITEGAGGSITAASLTGSSTGSTTLTSANHVGTLGSFTAAGFALTNAQTLAVSGVLDGGASMLLKTTAGNLAINGAVKGTTATLVSAGTIMEGAGGLITAGTLNGSSAGSTILLRANRVGALGTFSTGGDFALNNAQSLTVNNAPSANGGAGNLTLTTTGASSDLTLASNLTGNTVTLGAGRNINQTGGGITATTLTGNSIGSTTLNGANHIGALGSFTAANFALTNAQALSVNGPVDGGANTSLTTTAGDLAINGLVKGTTTTLISAGAITEGTGGSITANLLTGHSVGNTTLDGNNHINMLGSFSADFSLTNGQTLTVEGPLDGGPLVALTTTAGDLIINGAVTGTTTTLTSAGAISEGANGIITADTLSGSSAGSTSLLGANRVATLGAFTSGGDFAFNTIQTLTVNDAPSANGGAGDLTLMASGANSDLILASTLTGNTVTLGAGRNIDQTAGAIHANTLTGSSVGSTALGGANHIGTLGNFTAANFGLTNAQALAVTGSVDGSASTSLRTTSGDLAINGSVKGATTTLASAGAITEGAGGSITAGTLSGSSVSATTLNGANRIGTLGGFTAASFALTNAQTLAIGGTLDGGASTSLKTTSGDLAINGSVKGATATLTSAGAITEGAAGIIMAGTLTGSSVGATTLNGANQIGTLGSFTAANFALTNAQALVVGGPLDGGASTSLKTTSGDLAINGSVKGTAIALTSAGAISEGAGGIITAGTLSGSAVGPTVLGGAGSPNKNMVDTLGNFTSLAGFSMTNDKTLTLASVAGSAFTVNAGTSPFYLSVTHGDLFQLGTAPVYDGVGVWGATGRMGTGSQPIQVVGTGLQNIANVGLPPAYFYAVDSSGNLLPLGGGFAINVPTASGAGSAQNGNHGDSYIDPSVITANYRSYGIVPSGVRLPADQQSGCDPDQPDQAACQDPDALGMVMPWPKAPQ
ncbi:MAG: beta strand repeat-containing protein, partial [Rhodanobacter sp.]